MCSTATPTRMLHGLLSVLLSLALTTQSAAQVDSRAADAALPNLAQLHEGWNTLHPGGETTCAHGSEYVFYAREADPTRLVVYLYGGGGCWDAETCDPERHDTYTSTIEPARHPSRLSGIFDLDHPENPVAGYSMVAVPVCTGDSFLGDRDATYTLRTESGETREFTVHHRGQTNAMAAMRWIQANFVAPREIFVAGSSAGAVGTPYYASLLAQHHPAARVVGLGDDAGSYGSAAIPGADPGQWGIPEVLHRHPGWEDFEGDAGVEHLYITAARSAPNLRLYQFDHAYDGVQRRYLELARAEAPDVLRHLRANRRTIHDQVPEFQSFTAGGYVHTVLPGEHFYFYRTDGHRLRDWVAAIVAGETVASIDCTDCLRSGFVYDAHDLRIAERALEMLSPPGAWSPQDAPGACPAQSESFSIRCAVGQAAREVTGQTPAGGRNVPPALWDVLYTASERLGERSLAGVLQGYNNHPDTTAADVIAMIEEVRDRIRTDLAANR